MDLLATEGLTKDFPGIRALADLDFELEAGEIHGLVGENGAGKSTLVKILAGLYPPTRGRIFLEGRETVFRSPREASRRIGVVHQDRELIPFFNGYQNLFLGQEMRLAGFLQRKRMLSQAGEFSKRYGLEADLSRPVREIGSGQQEIITILKVLFRSPKILVFDEPTAPLSMHECRALFDLIRNLKKEGVTVLYISHVLPEVLDLADRITILRNGKKVATVSASEVDEAGLIRLMIAKDLEAQYPKRPVSPGQELFALRGYTCREAGFKDISFSIRAGEIVGFAGLVGSGRTELARAVFMGRRFQQGEVELRGRPLAVRGVKEAVRKGMVMIPENRRVDGIIGALDVAGNLALPNLRRLSRFGFIRRKRMAEQVERVVAELSIKIISPRQAVTTLSGGNQQKVVLGKWFGRDASLWIFDEPTQGIDVETKSEIYSIMGSLAEKGAGVWFISSDLRELTAISDRILVMRGFELVGEHRRPFSTEAILAKMLGKEAA